jgi:hypothetical protein
LKNALAFAGAPNEARLPNTMSTVVPAATDRRRRATFRMKRLLGRLPTRLSTI